MRKYFCLKVRLEYKLTHDPVGLYAFRFANPAFENTLKFPQPLLKEGNSLSRDVLPPSAQLGNLRQLRAKLGLWGGRSTREDIFRRPSIF